MDRSRRRFTPLVFTLVTALLLAGATHAKKKKKSDDPPSSPITQWLVLGPVAAPLPAFHDEKKGGYALDKLAETLAKPPGDAVPAPGQAQPWFGGRSLQWSSRETDRKGELRFSGAAAEVPNVAWLATWVRVDRFRTLELQVDGKHARALWLGNDKIASAAKDGELKGKLKLRPGKHLVLVSTLRDPENEEPWGVNARWVAEEKKALEGIETSLDPKRAVDDIVDIVDPPDISSLAISPAGDYVAVSIQRYLPGTDDRESWIEVRSTTDGELFRTWRGGFDMSRVAWAPTGRRLSYVTREGSGSDATSTLWLADLETRRVEPVLERVSRLGGYWWSPAGDTVVFSTSVEAEKIKDGVKRLESLFDRWAGHRTKSYLSVVSIPGKAQRRLTAGALSTEFQDFSPDGKKILFSLRREVYEERPFSNSFLFELDLATLRQKELKKFRWLGRATYSPDGSRILVQGGASEFDGGANVPEGVVPNLYDGQLFIWNPATGEADAITREFDPSVNSADWSRADGMIYLTADARDYVRLYRYDPARRSFSAIDVGFDVVGQLRLADARARAVATGTSPWEYEGLVAVDLKSESSRLLFRPAEKWFAHLERGKVEPWSFTASNGKTIDGRIYFPPGFDASRKYPVIVYYYGGTSPTSRSWGGRYPKEYWASNGYIVYTLQPSGATGFGQEFSAEHVNNWGKTTADEIIEGTKKFLEAHPFADAGAVGCIGASYGGFMTMLLATKTDIYSAAVAHAGISALSSYWGEGYWGYLYSSVATADSYPWNRRDLYVDQSPLFRADKTRVPILLTHGAADTNVPVGESDQFFIALKLLGKDVEYLQVEGENHWILDHPKRIRWSRSIVAWFDRHLKKQPEWWDALYPSTEADEAEGDEQAAGRF